ncbi:MAG: IPT/TIG domain-containing protein [Bryobacteraceae bacterium]
MKTGGATAAVRNSGQSFTNHRDLMRRGLQPPVLALRIGAALIRTTIGAAALVACALSPLLAGATLVLSPDGITVYDTVNKISWLADANLAASNRFVLPVCNASGTQPCVNPSGSMSYQAATAWVKAMNAANYLGHTNWQLPTTPLADSGCNFTGPQANSFGFNCSASALGWLYYNALSLTAPNTAVPIPNNTAGPFSNFQPNLYWSQTTPPNGTGYGTFSFNSGFQGSNTAPNFLYALPMIAGKISGTPPATGTGLEVNPGGQTVYDPVTNVTWLANANLAASNTFGLPPCKDQSSPNICVNQGGAMNWNSASQFVANMNTAGYLGQTHWQLPPVDPGCDVSYVCTDAAAGNPFGELFYGQLGLSPGTPVVTTPDIAVGPFNNMQPYLYWACEGATIQDACQTAGPAAGFEWSFSFGNGFEGTDVLANDLYVTAYFVGPPSSASGPVIAEVANAEGESPTIAPNTWVEIKGVNLAPAGDARIWQGSDFVDNKMPTQLDGVSATVNGKAAYLYYISPTQVNILTPPDAMSGSVQVQVTANGTVSAQFTAQAQAESPSFFVFNGGPYVAATHANGNYLGPASLYPGSTTPAKPGETVVIYANGFGPTSGAVVSGAETQSGTLSPLPVIKIGGVNATVAFAGLNVAPGEFQFNVVVPASLANGDQPITATYSGLSTQTGTLITVHQ